MINKQPLFKFSLWFITGLFIMFWGITHPAAASYNYEQFMAQLYDNYGPTLSAVTTNQTNNRWEGTIPDMTAYSSGAAWGISSPVVLIAGHTYSLTAKLTGYYGGNIIKSTYDRIGVGDTLNNAKISYQNNSNVNELYSSAPQTYGLIQYAFTTNVNGNYIVFPFATSYTGSNQTFWLENIVIDDLGASGVSQSQITNSLNNQTNTINNSITNSENNIKSNSNKNKQEIIDNQNENAKETQDVINNNLANVCSNLIDPPKFNVCTFSNNSDNLNNCNVNIIDTNINAGYVQYSSNSNWNGVHSDYMKVNVYTSYTLSFYNMSYQNTGVICPKVNFYNSNKQFLSQDITCFNTQYVSKTYTTPYNASYARISFDTEQPYSEITIDKITFSENGTFCPFGKTTSKLDDTNNAINGLNDTLNDDTAPVFDSSSISISPNTPISNILLLPISLLNSILTQSNSTCSPISIPFLFDTTISFPCFTISDYLGDTANIIDLCICFVMIYNILMLFVSVFEDITTLRDGFLSLYEPRHAYSGYHPKHGKE